MALIGRTLTSAPKTRRGSGLDQVMVYAETLPDMPAAVTDQSDAWSSVSVMGDAQTVLARLVHDLTEAALAVAAVASCSTLAADGPIMRP